MAPVLIPNEITEVEVDVDDIAEIDADAVRHVSTAVEAKMKSASVSLDF